MNNQFNIQSYFTRNYNLGDKPSVSKFKIKFLSVILILASLALVFVFPPVGIVGVLLFGFIFIGLPVMKISKEKKAAEEWQKNYNIRSQTWDAEFDKFYAARVAKLNPKKAAIQKLNLNLNPDFKDYEKDLSPAEKEEYPTIPFDIYGKSFDSYYRYNSRGEARTDANEITWFFFSQEQIYIYNVQFKLTDDMKKENTQEFFFEDIVSVSVGTKSIELNKSKGFGKNDSFVETEEFKLVVPGDQMFFKFTTNEEVSNSIKSMKDLIRTKKKRS